MATDPKTDPNPDILDFSTRRPRRSILIDGQAYGLRRRDDLSIDEGLFVDKELPVLGQLLVRSEDGKGLPAADVRQRSVLLQRIIEIAVQAPPAVLNRLTEVQRVKVLRVFLELPTRRPAKAEAKTPRKTAPRGSRSTGTKRSHA